MRHEALVRREALGIEGGVRPPRWAVAAAWWELSAVRSGRRRGGREAALTKPGRFGTARRAGSGERDQTVYEQESVTKLRKRGTGSNLVDMGRDAVHGFPLEGRLRSRLSVPVGRPW
ncbi:hypothetical protein GCM10023075_60470 [Streptosporangium album]